MAELVASGNANDIDRILPMTIGFLTEANPGSGAAGERGHFLWIDTWPRRNGLVANCR